MPLLMSGQLLHGSQRAGRCLVGLVCRIKSACVEHASPGARLEMLRLKQAPCLLTIWEASLVQLMMCVEMHKCSWAGILMVPRSGKEKHYNPLRSLLCVGLHLMFSQAVPSPWTVLALPVRPTLSAWPVVGSETLGEGSC